VNLLVTAPLRDDGALISRDDIETIRDRRQYIHYI